MAGPRFGREWSGLGHLEDVLPAVANFDFFDLKGVIDALCATFNVRVSYAPTVHPNLHPGRTAEVCAGRERIGVLGQLHPTVAEKFDLHVPAVLVAELDFENLLQVRQPLVSVQTPSRFPPADRDVAIIVDESVPHADVHTAIVQAAGPLLEHVQLFDVYTGPPIPSGRKNLAFSLRYRALDRTLEDDEVSTTHMRVEDALRTRFGADIRGR